MTSKRAGASELRVIQLGLKLSELPRLLQLVKLISSNALDPVCAWTVQPYDRPDSKGPIS